MSAILEMHRIKRGLAHADGRDDIPVAIKYMTQLCEKAEEIECLKVEKDRHKYFSVGSKNYEHALKMGVRRLRLSPREHRIEQLRHELKNTIEYWKHSDVSFFDIDAMVRNYDDDWDKTEQALKQVINEYESNRPGQKGITGIEMATVREGCGDDTVRICLQESIGAIEPEWKRGTHSNIVGDMHRMRKSPAILIGRTASGTSG